MNHSPNSQPAMSLNLADAYYVLFRHKWKITGFAAAGALIALIIFVTGTPVFRSEAKVLIRYVLESKSVPGLGDDAQLTSPGKGGDNIINSEVEILTSWDLALQVADAVGPEKILANQGGGTDRYRAAGMIRGGLTVEVPKKSNILKVTLAFPDRELPQPLLSKLIEAYLNKHAQVHLAAGIHDEFLSKHTDQLRSRLGTTEDEIRKLKTRLGVISLEDSKRAFSEEIARIRQDLFSAQFELAERQATLKGLEPAATPGDGVQSAAQRERVNTYKSLTSLLTNVRNQESQLLARFTEEHPLVASARRQITETEKQIARLEAENPNLALLGAQTSGSPQSQFDPVTEARRLTALSARINSLTNRLEQIRLEASGLEDAAPAIRQLERKREIEEANYRRYSTALDQARVDDAMGPGKVSNVSIVQAPAPPGRDMALVLKPAGIALAVGLLGGIALALLIEFFLDQSLRRPFEVETRLQLPLFLSIPSVSSNGHFRMPFLKKKAVPTADAASAGVTETSLTPNGSTDRLRPYFDALRDRLIMEFQIKNMTHKPKLVAVTSSGKGAGVSTIAGGLASALSETGDGNVLLVDMNLDQGAAQPYHRGKPACSLSEALEHEKRDSALVQENLYVVLARDARSTKPNVLPKQLTNIVPKLKASDYDYIIFDMPAVSQTSVTPKLAGLMDMVLMVVESEKAHRDGAERAKRLLAEAEASVAVVFNKHRPYVPPKLLPEF
ncbi:MAG: hypothetical protein HYY24_01980 [Verrucomicrobia bacterium]|nr:hypothetical protein [Verrucomicrobiota bacterium]